jgi:hypothetical protein
MQALESISDSVVIALGHPVPYRLVGPNGGFDRHLNRSFRSIL